MKIHEILLDNSKSPINIGKVDDKNTLIEKMSATNPNYTKNKNHIHDYDKTNCDGDKVGGEKQESDNLKSLD